MVNINLLVGCKSMGSKRLRRGVSIIGSAVSKFGAFPGKNSRDLMADAYIEALASVDKGFDARRVEALFLGNFTSDLFEGQSHLGHLIADHLGLAPRPATRIEGACASSGLAFRQGVMSIASGLHDIVLVGGVEKMTDASAAQVQSNLAIAGEVPMEVDQAGFTFPALFAAMASAYMDKYGVTREYFMRVAIKNHENGSMNPKAQFQDSLSDTMLRHIQRSRDKGRTAPTWRDEIDFLSDEKTNPVVAWPLHLFDCSPVTDGASCMLLVAEELASSFTDKPVSVLATSQASAGPFNTWGDNITSIPSVRVASSMAYDMAGITPADVDIAEVHDCFTSAEIMAIEDLGFFRPGHGAFATAEGRTTRDGDIPINVSGGLKAKGHPVGATGTAQLNEAWAQLRGDAGERQVNHKDLRIALTHNAGGTGGTCAIHILERR